MTPPSASMRAHALLALADVMTACAMRRTGELVSLDPVWSEVAPPGPRTLAALVDAADRGALESGLLRLDGGEARVTFDARLTGPDGAVRTLAWRLSLDAGAEVVLAVARDVTRARDDARERETAEARAAAIISALPDPVLVLDGALRVVDVHAPDRLASLVAPERLRGRALRDLVPAHLAETVEAAVRRRGSFECALDLGDPPKTRHLHANVAPLAHGGGAVVVVRDISTRVESERALRRHQQHLEEAQAMTHLGSWEYDVTTREIVWSDELFRIFGLTRRGPGPSFEEYTSRIHPDDRMSTYSAIERATRDGTPYDLWYRVQRPSGEWRHLQCHGEAVRDATGAIVGLRGTALDRTEERQRALDLVRAREEALDASRLKSQFLANMSHEIRTPLNGMLGMTALALETAMTAEQRELVGTAHASAATLLDLVNDLLDLSKIEAGAFELVHEPFSLAELAGDVVRTVAPRADDRDLELVLDVGASLPSRVVGDRARVRQVLTNLVGNAVKFTRAGTVTVRLDRVDGGVALTVRDTGIGIPEDRVAAIFEPFTQVDGSITRRFGGTGLGLSISRELVTRMGGRIAVESREGEGSAFTVTLPLPAAHDGGLRRPMLPGLRALVFDDHVGASTALVATLTACGASAVAVAHEGELSEALATDARWDLVLVDAAGPNAPAHRASVRARVGDHAGFVALTGAGIAPVDAPHSLRKPVTERDLVALARSLVVRPATSGVHALVNAVTPMPCGRVLVAEDNEVNARVLTLLLERRGFAVEVVTSGRDTVERVAQERFDLVLMDVQMPDVDGLEATRRIRERERTEGRHTPVIAITASAMQGDEARCVSVGMDAYLSKPVLPQTLFDTIQRVLRRASAAAATQG